MDFIEALRNICGRCKREKGTCRTCPVIAVVEEHDTEEYVEHQLELIRSMTVQKLDNWYVGTIDGYPYQVKVASEDSPWGIDNGRIIKLFVTEKPDGENKGEREIISYERGWDIYPEDNREYEDLIDALHEYFQNHCEEEIFNE